MRALKSTGKYVWVHDDVRGCDIFEHDKVWLDANGYPELKSITEYGDGSYVIHHINGDRSDNRLTNLQLLTRSEHAKLHAKYRDPEINARISQKLKGVKKSELTKKRMSEAQKKNPSRGMLGKHLSEESKKKMSESNKLAWMNKPQEEKDLLNEKNRQWHLGKPAPNKGIPCPEHQKHQLSKYWKEQYANGYVSPSTGRIFVNNGEHNKQIYPEDLQKYLDIGYVRGMKPRKRKE